MEGFRVLAFFFLRVEGEVEDKVERFGTDDSGMGFIAIRRRFCKVEKMMKTRESVCCVCVLILI